MSRKSLNRGYQSRTLNRTLRWPNWRPGRPGRDRHLGDPGGLEGFVCGQSEPLPGLCVRPVADRLHATDPRTEVCAGVRACLGGATGRVHRLHRGRGVMTSLAPARRRAHLEVEPSEAPEGNATEVRVLMHLRGYRPMRIKNGYKHPMDKDWPPNARRDPPLCVTEPLSFDHLSTGMLCDGLRVVDVDIEDQARADQVVVLAEKMLGPAPMRFRANSHRAALLYRAAEGEPRKASIVGRDLRTDADQTGSRTGGSPRLRATASCRWSPPLWRPVGMGRRLTVGNRSSGPDSRHRRSGHGLPGGGGGHHRLYRRASAPRNAPHARLKSSAPSSSASTIPSTVERYREWLAHEARASISGQGGTTISRRAARWERARPVVGSHLECLGVLQSAVRAEWDQRNWKSTAALVGIASSQFGNGP